MFFVELWLLTNTLAPLSGSAPRSRSRDGVDLDEVRACGCGCGDGTARHETYGETGITYHETTHALIGTLSLTLTYSRPLPITPPLYKVKP